MFWTRCGAKKTKPISGSARSPRVWTTRSTSCPSAPVASLHRPGRTGHPLPTARGYSARGLEIPQRAREPQFGVEAAFAGALGLKLGGPAVYGDRLVSHPWLGEGTPHAAPVHIFLAVCLLRHTVIVFTLLEVLAMGQIGMKYAISIPRSRSTTAPPLFLPSGGKHDAQPDHTRV